MQKYKKLIYCVILLLIFIITTLLIKKYFKPFMTIVIIFYLSNPVYKFLYKHKIFSCKISALLSIIFINAIIFLMIICLGNFIIDKIGVFMSYGLIVTDKFKVFNIKSVLDINVFIKDLKYVFNSLYSNEFIKKGAFYTTEGILAYFVGNIIVYFILVDKNLLVKYIKDLITEKNSNFLRDKFRVMSNIIRIEVFLVIIITIETIVGFLILGIKQSMALGLICGILDIIPYIGTIVVFIPLILYKFYYKQYIIVIGLILLYILLAINRQVLEVRFMSDKFKIHPLMAIISFYIGVKFFGLIGMFMGPLYILTVKELILT